MPSTSSHIFHSNIVFVMRCICYIVMMNICARISCVSSQCMDVIEGTCIASSYCEWSTDCRCTAKDWAQDIAFIFDNTDGWTNTQFNYAVTFASNLLTYASPNSTRAAIFLSGQTTVTTITSLAFEDEPLANTISTTLPALTKSSFNVEFFLKEAVFAAQTLFLAQSPSTARRILIVFAGSAPNVACQIKVRDNDIYTYVLAIRGLTAWDEQLVLCLGASENNYEGVTVVDDASLLTSDPTYIQKFEAFTCPHSAVIKLTEVAFELSTHPQYIELYNVGHDFDASALVFGGGSIGGNLADLSSTTISQGSYLVVYNRDAPALPNCNACGCASTAVYDSYFCVAATATYLGCCATCATYTNLTASTTCTWSVGSPSSWTITVTMDSVALVSVTHNTAHASGGWWPHIGNELPAELMKRAYNMNYGSSWTSACTSAGTPGEQQDYSTCSYTDCAADTCNFNLGGSGACTSSSGSCTGCDAGFYPFVQTCLPLPLPPACEGLSSPPSETDYSYTLAEWDGAHIYRWRFCSTLPGDGGCPSETLDIQKQSGSINPRTLPDVNGRNENTTTVQLRWSLVLEHYSERTDCAYNSRAPTAVPTQAPTFTIPQIPECEITLTSDRKSFTVSWSPILPGSSANAPPTNVSDYFILHNGAYADTAQCCTKIISISPEVYNVTGDYVSMYADWLSELEPREQAVTRVCTEVTQPPTAVPTQFPSTVPTTVPTGVPTTVPTPSPTISGVAVVACVGQYYQSSTFVNITFVAPLFSALVLNGSRPTQLNSNYHFAWVTPSNNATVDVEQYPATIVTEQQDIDVSETQVTQLWMYVRWTGVESGTGNTTLCEMSTYSPSPAPTNHPSTDPSHFPSGSPSVVPTGMPSTVPTPSPTFVIEPVLCCVATFYADRFEVEWCLLELDASGVSTALAEEVRYHIMIDAREEIGFQTDERAGLNVSGIAMRPFGLDAAAVYNSETNVSIYAEYSGAQYAGLRTAALQCQILTQVPTGAPSRAPTTQPTPAPTFSAVYVFINEGCEAERCGCTSSYSSTDLNATQILDQDADATAFENCCNAACALNFWPTPIVVKSEKETVTEFTIKRTLLTADSATTIYPYDIKVKFSIDVVDESIADDLGFYYSYEAIRGNFILQSNDSGNGTVTKINVSIPEPCYFNSDLHSSSACPYYNGKDLAKARQRYGRSSAWCDWGFIPGPRCTDITSASNYTAFISRSTESASGGGWNRNNEGSFDLNILKENSEDRTDDLWELFLLSLDSCHIVYDDSYNASMVYNEEDMPQDGDEVDCHLIYPSKLFVIVFDTDSYSEISETKIKDESYNDWFWYVILAAVILLGVLAYIAYRWWVNKKMKQADVNQIDEDIDDVFAEQEFGFGAGLTAEQIHANPLASPIGHISKPVDAGTAEYGHAGNQQIKDAADVAHERFDERHEYGQQRGADDVY